LGLDTTAFSRVELAMDRDFFASWFANWWHELFIVMLTISSSHWLSAETRATEKANFSEIS